MSSSQQNYPCENISQNGNELDFLKSRCQLVENRNEALKSQLEEALVEVEENENYIESLRIELNAWEKELETAEKKLMSPIIFWRFKVEDMSNVITYLESENHELENTFQ